MRIGGENTIRREFIPRHIREAERHVRPFALAIEESHWPDFYLEFGDRPILHYDGRLCFAPRPATNDETDESILERHSTDPVATQIIVLLHKLNDAEIHERTMWLAERRAFHSFFRRKTVLQMIRFVVDYPNDMAIRYSRNV